MKIIPYAVILAALLLLPGCGGGGHSGGGSNTGLYAYVPCQDGTVLQYDVSTTGALSLASSVALGAQTDPRGVSVTIPNAIAIDGFGVYAYVTESAADGSYAQLVSIKLGSNGALEPPFRVVFNPNATSYSNIASASFGGPDQIFVSVSAPQEDVEEYGVDTNGVLTLQASTPGVGNLVIPINGFAGFGLTSSGIQEYVVSQNGTVSPVGAAVTPPGTVINLAGASDDIGGGLYALLSSGASGQITVQQYAVGNTLISTGVPQDTGLTGNHAFLAFTPNGPYAYIASATSSGAGIIQKYTVTRNGPLTPQGQPISIPHAPTGLTLYGPFVANSTAGITSGAI